jgi:hypothetical protein
MFITSNLTQKLMNKVTQKREAIEKGRRKQIQENKYFWPHYNCSTYRNEYKI